MLHFNRVNHWTLAGFAALVFAGPFATSFAENKVEQAVQDLKGKAFDLTDKQKADVTFAKGSAAVTDGERSDLKALVDAAKSDSKIAKVVVAAWSDNEMPKDKSVKLADADRKLADERAKAVETELKALGASKIETHSMAEYPSWIARTFNTDDAKVKGEGRPSNVKDAVLEEIGREIREAGGPGKAVVFILHTDEGLSH